jgi:hypothetical protein
MAVQNYFTVKSPLDPRFSVVGVLVAAAAGPTITQGTPSKSADAATAATGAVVPMIDGDGTIAQNFTGIAKSDSSEVAATAGTVDLWIPLPGIIYAGKTLTSTTCNTAAKLITFFRKRVVFDLSATVWTVDAAATDALVNCVTIIGGEWQTGTVYFVYKPAGTYIGQHQTS